jgi:hypothetical protein
MSFPWRGGRVVMQRPAKPCTPVRFRPPPPDSPSPSSLVQLPSCDRRHERYEDGYGLPVVPRGIPARSRLGPMADWSREEAQATVSDYLETQGAELAGVPYSKVLHRRRLVVRLHDRSEASVQFKHANISAVRSRIVVVREVEDILSILTTPPARAPGRRSSTRRDCAAMQGFDIRSFEETGEERLFRFRAAPRLFILNGALSTTCTLAAATYMAAVRAAESH